MQVAGQPNKRLPPIERIHKAYRERCTVFADALGWDKNSIADWFEQFCWMRQKEQRMPVNLAAFFAWQDIKAFFNKAGNEFD
jgi:hypothetical protein